MVIRMVIKRKIVSILACLVLLTLNSTSFTLTYNTVGFNEIPTNHLTLEFEETKITTMAGPISYGHISFSTSPIVIARQTESDFGRFQDVVYEPVTRTIHFVTTITENTFSYMLYGFVSLEDGNVTVLGKYRLVSINNLGTLFVINSTVHLVWVSFPYNDEVFHVSWEKNILTKESVGLVPKNMAPLYVSTKPLEILPFNEYFLILGINSSSINDNLNLMLWDPLSDASASFSLPLKLGSVLDYSWSHPDNALTVLATNGSATILAQYVVSSTATGLTTVLNFQDFHVRTTDIIDIQSKNDIVLLLNRTKNNLEMLEYQVGTRTLQFLLNVTFPTNFWDYKAILLNESHVLILYTLITSSIRNTRPLYQVIVDFSNQESFTIMTSSSGVVNEKQSLIYIDHWSFDVWANYNNQIIITYLAYLTGDDVRRLKLAESDVIAVCMASTIPLEVNHPYIHEVSLKSSSPISNLVIGIWLVVITGAVIIMGYYFYRKKFITRK